VHSLVELKELVAEVGAGHLGFVLDTWHWWTAGERGDEIRSLQNIVAVDLNDAPAGIPIAADLPAWPALALSDQWRGVRPPSHSPVRNLMRAGCSRCGASQCGL
jgi:sugar phosphate isomerase/epimerase